MNMKNKSIKIISLIACAALVTSGGIMYFNHSDSAYANSKAEKDIKKAEKEIDRAYPSLLKSNGDSKDKIETTYAIMDSDGKLRKTIVSEQLANNKKEKTLNDISNLKNIENTSGNEKFTQDGNNLKWNAGGNKIQYKGNATSELPVDVKVTYYLEGQRKTAKEIAGKSGNITIRFDYDVKKEEVANGKTYKHPYTMASGLILDNSHFSDVKVSGGKAVDNGNQTIAFGVAFPSMNENLGIDRSKMNIPSFVEISAYTDKFEIAGTYTIALSGLFNDIDTTEVSGATEKIQELKNGLNLLSDSSNKLLKGADDLSAGATEFDKGMAAFVLGVNKLQDGSGQLTTGMDELSKGLMALSANSSQINDGVAKLELSIFDDATKQMRSKTGDESITLTPATYVQVIKGISDNAIATAEHKLRASLAKQGVTDANLQNQILSVAYNSLMASGKTEASMDEISGAIKNAGVIAKEAGFVQKSIDKNQSAVIQILKGQGYTDEQITTELIAVYSTALELAGGNPNAIDSKIQETAKEYVKATVIFKNGGINASDNVSKLAAIAIGKETPKQLVELKTNLDQVESLVSGIRQYTSGVDSAAMASQKISSGMGDLNKGILDLKDGSMKLSSASKKLKTGINSLDSGLHRFNNEGIEKFVNGLKGNDITNIVNNLEGVKAASSKEVFVGGKLDEISGESKIIFKTGEIK
ncbi:MAG: hypothetical protein ACLTE8_05790 [Christensenellales bacterium]